MTAYYGYLHSHMLRICYLESQHHKNKLYTCLQKKQLD